MLETGSVCYACLGHPGNLFLLIPVKIHLPWEQPTISRLTPRHLQQTRSASVAGTVWVLIEKKTARCPMRQQKSC